MSWAGSALARGSWVKIYNYMGGAKLEIYFQLKNDLLSKFEPKLKPKEIKGSLDLSLAQVELRMTNVAWREKLIITIYGWV